MTRSLSSPFDFVFSFQKIGSHWILICCLFGGAAVAQDLSGFSSTDLLAAKKEAQRRVELLRNSAYLSEHIAKQLKSIQDGEPQSEQKPEVQRLLKKSFQLLTDFKKQTPAFHDTEMCRSIFKIILDSATETFSVLYQTHKEKYYLATSQRMDRVKLELLIYQLQDWFYFFSTSSELGTSLLVPGRSRSCEFLQRLQYILSFQNILQSLVTVQKLQLGRPGYLHLHEFIAEAYHAAGAIYARDRNILIGSLVGGIVVPWVLFTRFKNAKYISAALLVWNGTVSGRWAYSAFLNLKQNELELRLPSDQNIFELMHLNEKILQSEAWDYLEMIDTLALYYEADLQLQIHNKIEFEKTQKIIEHYLKKYKSSEAAQNFLLQQIQKFEIEISKR